MFLALRELRFARGRFALMGLVVALIAVLTVVLTGLAEGLVRDGVSGLQRLPATHLAFEQGVTGDLFSRSTVDDQALATWSKAPGVAAATLYGNSLVHAKVRQTGADVDLALFGVTPGSFLTPTPSTGRGLGATPNGVLVSRKLVDDGVKVGDTLVVDRLGTQLPVIGTIGEASFGHVAVVYAPLHVWQGIHYGLPGTPPPDAYRQATAVALRLSSGADVAATDKAAGTQTLSRSAAYDASPGYTAETATMLLIRVFLYVIATLVVGAFFVVWTVQRKPEIALVKALGASSAYLVRDALTQVAVVLVAATAAGAAAGVAMGALFPRKAPFSLTVVPVTMACALLVVLGLIGAFAAVRRITKVDPLLALGGNR